MAQYNTSANAWTPVALADSATMTTATFNNAYQALRAATAGIDRVIEVFMGGEATSSTVNQMTVRRHSTHSTGQVNVVPAALNPLSAASVAQGFVTLTAGTSGVVGAATAHLLNVSFNAFGGIIRWVAAPGEELYITANTAPNDEISLASVTGTGKLSSHIVFEEL